MLLVGWQEGHKDCKKHGGWWRWALVTPDGVALSRMVGVSASVNLPLHHKLQKFSSGTGSPGWSRKKGRKTVAVIVETIIMAQIWSTGGGEVQHLLDVCVCIMKRVMKTLSAAVPAYCRLSVSPLFAHIC